MEYLSEEYLKKRIEQNQKFLVSLLNLHIGNFYPLRKWLGIAYKGKIDEVSHLSIGYNTKYFKKGKKWYKQQTREYQQPDLGYKLNLVLDRIPQLVLLPALLQPAFRLASVLLFSLTTTTYQPSTADTRLSQYNPNTNYGSGTFFEVQNVTNYFGRSLLYFDTSDIPDGVTFSQGDLLLYVSSYSSTTFYIRACRLTQTAWTEMGATWNKYDGTNSWTTAGGDFTTTNSVEISLATSGWATWNASSLIQDCYNNQSKKVHLLLKSREDNAGGWRDFYSREYTDDPSLRPKLTVTYTAPINSSFFLFFNN